jgi:tetratricopeptide (TPR) repeat protein
MKDSFAFINEAMSTFESGHTDAALQALDDAIIDSRGQDVELLVRILIAKAKIYTSQCRFRDAMDALESAESNLSRLLGKQLKSILNSLEFDIRNARSRCIDTATHQVRQIVQEAERASAESSSSALESADTAVLLARTLDKIAHSWWCARAYWVRGNIKFEVSDGRSALQDLERALVMYNQDPLSLTEFQRLQLEGAIELCRENA